jgi:hypothetical protein
MLGALALKDASARRVWGLQVQYVFMDGALQTHAPYLKA